MLIGTHVLRILCLFNQESTTHTTSCSCSTSSISSIPHLPTNYSRIAWLFTYVLLLGSIFGVLIYSTITSNANSVPDIMDTNYLLSERLTWIDYWMNKALKTLVSN